MVLVVEDDPAVRDITSKLLQRSGFRVTPVADGASALVAFGERREPITCIVTDVIMPNMSGIELADRMHEIDPSVGIVLLSGYTAETLAPRSRDGSRRRIRRETGHLTRAARCGRARHLGRASQRVTGW